MASEIKLIISAEDRFSDVLQKYNTATKDAATNTTTTATAAKDGSSNWDALTASLTAGIAAYAGMKGVQIVGELIAQGDAANRAESTFRALTDSIGGYNQNLQAVRGATGGIVNDMDLMNASSKMLQMGLVSNTDELARMMGMAVQLGSSMGMDANKALSDFSLMLANSSLPRLDQFGISSGRVRDRIKELQDSMEGLSRQDAFKMAVMEEGANALDRLGEAASAAETPLARLGTALQNFGQDFSQRVATGVQGIVGIIEVAAGQNPIQQQQAQQAEAQRQGFTDEYYGLFTDAFSRAGGDVGTGETANMYKNQFTEMYNTITQNPDLLQDPTYLGDYLTNIPERYRQQFVDAWLSTYQLAQDEAAAQAANAARTGRMASMITSAQGYDAQGGDGYGGMRDYLAQQNVAATWGAKSSFYADGGDTRMDSAERMAQFHRENQQRAYQEMMQQRADAAAQMNQGYRSMWGEGQTALGIAGLDTSMDLFGQQQNFTGALGTVGDYATQGQAETAAANAAALQAEYQKAADELARMQALADQGLIPPDDLTRAQTLTTNLQNLSAEASSFADQTARAADALANMTLSEAFGQQGGGMLGEISDMIMSNLGENVSPEQQQAIQNQLDLTSGRQTQSSLAMQNTVAPLLADIAQADPAQAAQAMQNVQEFLKAAKLAGLGDEQIASMLPQATGFQAQAGGGYAAATGLGGQGQYSAQQLVNVGMGEQAAAAAASQVSAGNMWGNAGAMQSAFGTNGVSLTGASGGATAAGAGATSASTESEQLAKAMGTAANSADRVRASTGAIASAMGTATSAADTFITKIGTMPTSKRVTVTIDVNDPSGLMSLLAGGASTSEAMAGATQDAGGKPPGSNGNTRADR